MSHRGITETLSDDESVRVVHITFDHVGKIKDGAWVGITGENIDIADDI